jgi:enoyl-CoA hydratase/carnithine racemase
MDLETLTLEVAEGIATVALNRPPVHAMNRAMRDELIAVFDALSDRPDVRVVLLTASGRTFCAGADIKERRVLVKQPGDYIAHNRVTREAFWAVSDCTKPVICAANGPAIGAGLALMLAADIMLAAEEAWFRMPEIDVGLAGGGRFMMDALGKSWARLLYFTGRKVPAAEFHRLGVICACPPAERLIDEAMAIAREIASKNPRGVAAVKRGFQVADGMPYRDAYRYEQTITHDLSATEETRALQTAFVEKGKSPG